MTNLLLLKSSIIRCKTTFGHEGYQQKLIVLTQRILLPIATSNGVKVINDDWKDINIDIVTILNEHVELHYAMTGSHHDFTKHIYSILNE